MSQLIIQIIGIIIRISNVSYLLSILWFLWYVCRSRSNFPSFRSGPCFRISHFWPSPPSPSKYSIAIQMILHESWVRNKLRYWSILHLSIYIIASVAMITAIEEYSDEFFSVWILIAAGFQLFLVFTEVCYLAGLSYSTAAKNTRLITIWQVTFISLIVLISIGVITGLIFAIIGLVYEVIAVIAVPICF